MIAEPPSDAPVDPDLEWLGVIEDAAVDDDLGPAARTAGPSVARKVVRWSHP
jgi:hypothetical protein